MCGNECGLALTENVHIFCLSRGEDEEMTFCEYCWADCEDELRKEGWKSDEDSMLAENDDDESDGDE